MIVSISSGMADVHIDDAIEAFCPSRSADLVRLVGQLYREALESSVIMVEVED